MSIIKQCVKSIEVCGRGCVMLVYIVVVCVVCVALCACMCCGTVCVHVHDHSLVSSSISETLYTTYFSGYSVCIRQRLPDIRHQLHYPLHPSYFPGCCVIVRRGAIEARRCRVALVNEVLIVVRLSA